ncbi:MAG TPA: hypothetical protein VMZ69_03480 [Saprospiraceae bacterium]|nr:hypothetical protein [Saprospiraceae bacterium]
MKKNIFLPLMLLTLFVSSAATLSAEHLDGLWRNDRQNITIRIEQDRDGFRAKRSDQGVWYTYTLENDDVYIDQRGNWYEVVNEDQLEWNEAASRKRLLFHRVDSQNGESRTGRDRQDEWDNDYARGERDRINQGNALIEGRWYDKSSKERLVIEEINNGYRVRTQNGSWEKFSVDRSGQRLRSRSGDIIQMTDRNTLRWRSAEGRHDRTFIRQGNGQVRRDHGKANGHYKEKHSSTCKKHCG